jgi:UDP-3-O-[3-hydroxymyristoyl] glucosamine N-acyltransferase
MGAAVITLGEVADRLGVECRGDRDRPLRGLATLTSAGADRLAFLANPKYRKYLSESRAGAVILSPALADGFSGDCLIAADPYLAYARASRLFDRAPRPVPGVDPTASVAASARLGADVAIGPFVVIGEDVDVGAGTVIGAHCSIGAGSQLGAGCLLHARVTLYHDVSVGDGCILHSGVVLGGDGFGFAPSREGWVKIHQLGGVRVGRNVEIGANSTVDRGALDDTVISDGVIIDNQVQVAHNVRLGEGTAIAGCVGIAGSTTIGAHCTIAGGAGIAGHLTIADGVHVTAMALITRSIDRRGSYSSGTGTMETASWRRSAVRFSQLDELHRRVVELERQLARLTPLAEPRRGATDESEGSGQ